MPEFTRRRPTPAAEGDSPPKRPSIWDKMKAKPNWTDDTSEDVGSDAVDRLHIPTHLVSALIRDGVALQWVTWKVRGQDAPQEVAKYRRGGWTPVHTTDFDGIFDGLFLPKGSDEVITVEDCMLMCRPVAIHQKAKERDFRAAMEPLRIKQAELGAGLNVPGGNHPSATRQNKIVITREGIEVPRDINYPT